MSATIAVYSASITCLPPQPKRTWACLRSNIEANAKKQGVPYEQAAAARVAAIPAKRFGTADEFGATCAFLCSTHAGYITGQNLLIDGGSFPGAF